jgi:hypothetical protein
MRWDKPSTLLVAFSSKIPGRKKTKEMQPAGSYWGHTRRRDFCVSAREDQADVEKVLAGEIFHSLMDNLGDKLQDSDLDDLTHVNAVPYVDYFTSDRRIATHIKAASVSLGMKHHEKLFPNIKSLLVAL